MTEQTKPVAPFDPSKVEITYTFNFPQVNMILKGLGKLPLEDSEQLHNAIRGHAVQTLQVAEVQPYTVGGGA